ncbi:MaoC/PaaZ C-terminal domain-containing protein [Demetria terragena]|uniref:MaoC/PaaZ C-terminal domain-containing protein n=1 Tax=Demetria terragena TaxID=63959 RepID=UPI000360058B|nr:MaoC/PaaZ C-terminal domain-containing protein [Demetria terragena]
MPALADVTVGEALPGKTVHLDRADLVRYAGASGDFNPIHWDERTATGVGLPDVIAHGMLTMGAAMQIVVDWAGDPGRVTACSTRFSGMVPVPHGDGVDVEVGGTVKSVDADAGIAIVELTATCAGDKVLSRALATVRLD